MVDIDIIEQKPVGTIDLMEKLDKVKKEGKELNFRAAKVYAYLEEFFSERKKTSNEMYQKLSGLGIQKLRDRHIVKIVDIMPEDQDSLKAIFVGETVTLKQDELKQILNVVNG